MLNIDGLVEIPQTMAKAFFHKYRSGSHAEVPKACARASRTMHLR